MQDFLSRFTILSNAYSASLGWLVGDDSSLRSSDSAGGIDLGNGVELSALDVVESHFERLVNGRPANGRPTSEQTSLSLQDLSPQLLDGSGPANENSRLPEKASDVNGTESLNKAIGSLAPDLLPLVNVAEHISEATPPVAVSKEFRALLNEALVAEQKQQLNKKAIGIQPAEDEGDLLEKVSENKGTLLLGISFALALAIGLWYLFRPRNKE